MQEHPLTLRTTTPPWLHRCYVVRIIDFRISNANDCGGQSVNKFETALFVQTEDKPVSGQLFTVRQVPYSRTFTRETKPCQNPQHDPKFDSEAGIGYIFKRDFKELFPYVLTNCPMPHARGPEYARMSTESDKSHEEAWEYVEELQSPLTNSTE